jgi:hypothetical protein
MTEVYKHISTGKTAVVFPSHGEESLPVVIVATLLLKSIGTTASNSRNAQGSTGVWVFKPPILKI